MIPKNLFTKLKKVLNSQRKFNLPKLSSLKDFLNRKSSQKSSQTCNVNYERNFHKLTCEQLELLFNTSTLKGLDVDMARQLLLKHGKNAITQKKTNLVRKILGYFVSGFCGLIWLAAITVILAWKPIGNPPDPTNLGLGIMLILVIFIQAAFTAFQDWSSSKVMQSIKSMMPSSATVIRNGTQMKIPVEDMVVGDLVVLSYGTKVPADVRLVDSRDLKFDKSMLTGESEAIEGTVECTDERYIESNNIAYMTIMYLPVSKLS